jgi:preprotein translocase subunit SecG
MSFLLVIHVFIAVSLIGVILLQKSESGGGLVGGSSSSNSMFTARGAANLLTRITAVLAVLFIGNCILMTVMTSSHVRQSAAFLDAPASAPADQ